MASFRHTVTQGQHALWVAGLLLVAQLVLQPHLLGHLDHADEEGQPETVCELCLLGAGLDSANVLVAAGPSSDDYRSERSLPAGYAFVADQVFHAFVARAPPLLTSTA